MRAPGSVVILRHSYAPGGFDPPDSKLDDCSTQRNLDDDGRAQARRIGEAFRKNGVEVGKVLSSPRCRCLDTARLAFSRVEPWRVLQGALNDADLRKSRLADVRQVIAAHRTGPPLVLVTHGSVVGDLTTSRWASSWSCAAPRTEPTWLRGSCTSSKTVSPIRLMTDRRNE